MTLAQVSPIDPYVVLGTWTFDPLLVISLVVTGALYGIGVRRIWNAAGTGRVISRREVVAFGCGMLILAGATISPLHAAGLALFSAHMIQHEVLILIAAPLLILGRPLAPFLRALPGGAIQGLMRIRHGRMWTPVERILTSLPTAWLLHFVALWAWHVPSVFERALYSESAHVLEHVSFLGSALLFWGVLVRNARSREGSAAGVLYVFTTGIHNAVLGALLTFSSRPWYEPYALTAPLWGITPLEDQQLGGVIMWAPGGLVYVGAALLLLASLLRRGDERRVPVIPSPRSASGHPGNGESR
ncbi:MAG TPA: cytochrome c oxidase assembly protein [Rhodothermales bacterium]